MNPREEEANALSAEELNDLNAVVDRFNAGEYGFYGTRDHPGLLVRLSATQAYWDKIHQMGAEVKGTVGWKSTLEMPHRQLLALHQFLGYKLKDEEERFNQGAGGDLEAMKQTMVNLAFLKDMKKATQEAIKLSMEEMNKIVKSMPK